MALENVRLGIVGLGNMGKAHLANIRAGKVPGLRVTALCESHGTIPPLQEGETALLHALADRLRLWGASCQRQARALPPRLPQPPAAPLSLPLQWQAIEDRFTEPALKGLPPAQLERFAARFTLCRQALMAIECGERGWAALPRAPR
jgi:hypothetical protein